MIEARPRVAGLFYSWGDPGPKNSAALDFSTTGKQSCYFMRLINHNDSFG
jgi:hypothetical protein